MNIEVMKKQMYLLNISPSDIAETLQVGLSSVYRWLDGTTQKIAQDKLERLASMLQVTTNTLSSDKKHLVKPIIGVVKAGYDLYADESILGYEEVNEKEASLGDYYLRVVGDSMIGDGIFDGDLVFVEQVSDVATNTIAVVMIEDQVTIKRVVKKDGFLILASSNAQVENRIYNQSEIDAFSIRIIGRVLHAKRSFV